MKNTFFGIVIIILCIIAATQRGCLGTSSETKGPDTLVVHDTTWQVHDKTIVREIPVLKEIPADPQVIKEIPADYETLKSEYAKLQATHHAKRVYQDSIAVGKFGYIHVTDTVNQNTLGKRKTRDDFKIPVVKETMTITKYAEPTRQIYVGGGINAQSAGKVVGAETGIMYKTKKDQMIGVKFNANVDGTTSFGLTYYTRIQFKKK